MAFITQQGILFGVVPETTGRIFWVAPSDSYTIAGNSYSSSDGNDGLSPERALRTIDAAWGKVTATAGDVIVLLPGAHTVTAAIGADVAGVTMTGLARYAGSASRPITSITQSTAATDILTISANNIEVSWIHFIPITAADSIADSGTASGIHIHHCSFDMETPAASTSTQGVSVSGEDHIYIHDCVFYCDSAQGEAIDLGLGAKGGLVERCSFIQSAGTWASAMRCAATADANRGILVRECDFVVSAGTLTVGIIGVGGTTEETIHVHRCYFSSAVTTPIDTFGARGAEIAENYKAGAPVDATPAGGALITAIT